MICSGTFHTLVELYSSWDSWRWVSLTQCSLLRLQTQVPLQFCHSVPVKMRATVYRNVPRPLKELTAKTTEAGNFVSVYIIPTILILHYVISQQIQAVDTLKKFSVLEINESAHQCWKNYYIDSNMIILVRFWYRRGFWTDKGTVRDRALNSSKTHEMSWYRLRCLCIIYMLCEQIITSELLAKKLTARPWSGYRKVLSEGYDSAQASHRTRTGHTQSSGNAGHIFISRFNNFNDFVAL